IKHSLYKVSQKKVSTEVEPETLILKVEGSLNNRPLTYIEEKPDDTVTLRPIDFIQRDIIMTHPFESLREHHNDKDCISQEEESKLLTMQKAKLALLSKQYWAIWSQQYLKSIRESHKVNIDNKRGTPRIPTLDTVVLIHESVQPRNTWKMGRIVKLQQLESGIIREAEVRLPNQRIIRRPVNLLIPLEIGETEEEQAPATGRNIKDSPNEDSKEA
ncbi:hypothetical protein Angca_001090, partial [Angiostrongylus cantonensis]